MTPAPTTTTAPTTHHGRGRWHSGLTAAVRVGVVAAAGLVLGGLTSLGQAVLPDALASLANSSSGWTLPTALLVWLLARRYPEAAVAGAAGFVALVLGYAVVSGWRGIFFDPSFWAAVGVVAGPVVGAAAHALRRTPVQATVGGGVLGGILIGEAIYGLTVIASTTSPVYWWISAGIGSALVVAVSLRVRRLGLVLLTIGVAAAVAIAFPVAYLALGGLL